MKRIGEFTIEQLTIARDLCERAVREEVDPNKHGWEAILTAQVALAAINAVLEMRT